MEASGLVTDFFSRLPVFNPAANAGQRRLMRASREVGEGVRISVLSAFRQFGIRQDLHRASLHPTSVALNDLPPLHVTRHGE